MSIGKINPINTPRTPKQFIEKINSDPEKPKDSVSFSKQGLQKAELEKSIDIVKQSDVVRPKKVQQAKTDLKKHLVGDKIQEQVAQRIAEKIVDELL